MCIWKDAELPIPRGNQDKKTTNLDTANTVWRLDPVTEPTSIPECHLPGHPQCLGVNRCLPCHTQATHVLLHFSALTLNQVPSFHGFLSFDIIPSKPHAGHLPWALQGALAPGTGASEHRRWGLKREATPPGLVPPTPWAPRPGTRKPRIQ